VDPVRALIIAGGVARYRDLVDAGVHLNRLRDGVAEGRIVRPHRGCYALPTADPLDVIATVFRAEPCCVSILARAGIPVVMKHSVPHLALPNNRSLARPGLRDLETACFHRCDHYPLGAMARIPVALDMAGRCLGRRELLAAADGAVRLGAVTREQVRGFAITPRAERMWIARHVDGRSESPMESMTRATLIDAGLASIPQVQIPGVGRVDLLVERRVVVECDGYAYHSDRAAFENDRNRSRALSTLGIPHVRYASSDILNRPEQIVADVRALLWRAA